jgi:hypothetical protein
MSGIKNILLIIAIFSGFETFSQSNPITIAGKIDNLEGRHPVKISKPVERFFSSDNIDIKDSAFLENERFLLQLDIRPNSFIRLDIHQFGSFICYVDSASDISFDVMTNSNSEPDHVFFFGANAPANELMVNGQLLNPYGKQKDLIIGIIKRAANASAALDSLNIVLLRNTEKLTELYNNHKISVSCYNAFIAETEQRLLLCCKDLLIQGTSNQSLVKMKKKEFLTFINILFSEFDPFNKKYFATTIISDNIVEKCILINDGIIPAVISTPRDTWQRYAGDFTFIVTYFGVYDFAPNSLQQYLVGNALLAALSHSPLTKDEFMDVYTAYQNWFPGSPYNSIISNRLNVKVFPAQNNTKVKITINH